MECIEKLLIRVDPKLVCNLEDRHGRLPIHVAAGAGFKDGFWALAKHSDCESRTPDNRNVADLASGCNRALSNNICLKLKMELTPKDDINPANKQKVRFAIVPNSLFVIIELPIVDIPIF